MKFDVKWGFPDLAKIAVGGIRALLLVEFGSCYVA